MAYNPNRSNEPDYYKILGLTPKATDLEIKKAYRTKARELHPDKNKDDPKAQEKFIQAKAAYDYLSDNAKRVTYDNKRAQGERDAKRWAAFQAQYNQWSAPKSSTEARKDEDEWEALNRGEAYYTQWMKAKLAKKQEAERQRKRNNQSERQRLLREWEQDQRGRYERTVSTLKPDSTLGCPPNPIQTQNITHKLLVIIYLASQAEADVGSKS